MAAAESARNFRLEVRNFGPIVEADVELRPLTVFVGPSNTGKSYLSVLIYALHQVFGHGPIGINLPRVYRLPLTIQPFRVEPLDPPVDLEPDITAWVDQLIEGDTEFETESIEPVVRNRLEEYFHTASGRIVTEIARCFGIDSTARLSRKPGRDQAWVRVGPAANGDARGAFDLSFGLKDGEATANVLGLPELPSDFKESVAADARERPAPYREQPEDFSDIISSISEFMLNEMLGALSHTSYYLPADRTGVMHAHSVVVRSLLRRAPYEGLRRTADVGVLSGVLSDFLEKLIELESYQRWRRPRRRDPFAELLEQHVLQGTIHSERSDIGYPSFYYRPEQWRDAIPLMNASSMVSELAPVVLFLREVVDRNDLLIIEEPESHLHPEMQVAFTRLLAGAVQAGLRVVLTTHSEWVVETIGNLVELSRLPMNRRPDTPGGQFALPSEQVGMWLFQQRSRPRGSIVREVTLDADVGTYGVGYDAVAQELHNEWAAAASESS